MRAILSAAAPTCCRALSLVSLLLCCSCYFFRSAAVPMPLVVHEAAGDAPHTLIVLLPGLGSGPATYERHGFVEHVRSVDDGIDVVAADAHLAYYTGQSIVERLHEDVLAPRAERYDEVWLVGISLGGLGCAAYAQEHPDVVDRVLLLAPYIGTAEIYEPVIAAGGLRRWTPPPTGGLSDEHRRYVDTWRWYRERALAPGDGPAVYLGYGLEDRFRVPNGAAAAALPAARCFTTPGDHDWPTWKALFVRMLASARADAQ